MPDLNLLPDRVTGLAIDVHRAVGPELLETVFQDCMGREPADAGIPFQSQAMVPVHDQGRSIPLGFPPENVVADAIIPEIKAVAVIAPVHEAQILTCLRMRGIRPGFLMNVRAPGLKNGLKRCIV